MKSPSSQLESETKSAEPAVTEPEPALPERLAEIAEVTAAQSNDPAPVPAAFGALALAFVCELRLPEVELSVGGTPVVGRAAPTLHPSVLETAKSRGEPVLVERQSNGAIVVVGALRTQPTPGVDAMEEIRLEANKIAIKGREEITLQTSGVAHIALRAVGEIESYAGRILSRAEEVHKIVGRMLRLN